MTTIGVEICPACGRVTWLVRLHTGAAYFHGGYDRDLCLRESFVYTDEAESVRRIRERGGERLRLAAHP